MLGYCLMTAIAACGPADSGLELGEERLSDNEADNTARMIEAIEKISIQRYGNGIIKRFNQSRTLGCFDGTFTVSDILDADFFDGRNSTHIWAMSG